MDLGEAFVTIRARDGGLAADINRQLGGAMDKGAAAAEARLAKLGKGFADFGRKATIGVTLPVAAGLGFATKAASDLSEQVNKTSVVFGKAGASVVAFTKTSSSALGQSQRAALEAAGTYGNLFRAIGLTEDRSADMSKTLLTLTADLASFNNASPEDVFEALRAGLVGETEPLRRFGVNLNEARIQQEALNLGLATSKDAITPAVKAQAAYSLILHDTTLAQGDFARTSGGLANQTRILKAQLEDTAASIGAKLIPIALRVVEVVSKIADGFTSLPEPAQNLVLIGAGLVALVGPIASIGGHMIQLAGATSAFVKSFAAGAAVTESFASQVGAMSRVGLPLATAGLGFAAGAFLIFKARAEGAKKATQDFRQALADTSQTADQAFAKVVAIRLSKFNDDLRGLGLSVEEAARSIKGGEGAVDAFREKIKGAAAEAGSNPVVYRQLSIALRDLEAGYRGAVKEGGAQAAVEKELGVNTADAGKAAADAAAATAQATTVVAKAFTPAERLADAQKKLADATSSASDKFDAFRDAIDASLGVELSAEEAASRFRGSIDTLRESIKENGNQVGTASEKQRQLGDDLRAAVTAADAEVQAFARSGKSAVDAAGQKQALIDRLTELKRTFPQLSGPIDNYIAKVREIPTGTTLTVTANVSDAIADLDAVIRKTKILRQIERPDLRVTGTQVRAAGGPVWPGGTFIVGETRPETLVMFPGGGGMVLPDAPSSSNRRGGSGSGPLVGSLHVLEGANLAGLDANQVGAIAGAEVERALVRVLDRHEAGVA